MRGRFLILNLDVDAVALNTRSSFQCIAHQLKVELVEVRDLPIHGFAAKLHLDEMLSHPCRVIYLDRDVVVRHDCPNLLEIVPPGHFGFVPAGHASRNPEFYQKWHEPHFNRWMQAMGGNIPCSNERYINSGVMVFDLPEHAHVFERARRAVYEVTRNVTWYDEQAAISASIHFGDIKTFALPETFNYQYSFGHRYYPELMDAYIYHFNGCTAEQKIALANRTVWTRTLEEFEALPCFPECQAAIRAAAAPSAIVDFDSADWPQVQSQLHAGDSIPPDVSVIVTCKGRWHHLEQTLPSILHQACNFTYEVIIVDYGCPQDAFERLRELNLNRTVVLQVKDRTEKFSLSRARNCGAAVARGRVLAFVDADIHPYEGWLQHAAGNVLSGKFGLQRSSPAINGEWDRGGTCVVARELYDEVRGYDEGFRDWGVEDMDFYRRCEAITAYSLFPSVMIEPIRHSEAERVQFYDTKSINESTEANRRYREERGQNVNPNGYGQGQFRVFLGRGGTLPRTAAYRPDQRLRAKVRR
jgi:hypothetical protein